MTDQEQENPQTEAIDINDVDFSMSSENTIGCLTQDMFKRQREARGGGAPYYNQKYRDNFDRIFKKKEGDK